MRAVWHCLCHARMSLKRWVAVSSLCMLCVFFCAPHSACNVEAGTHANSNLIAAVLSAVHPAALNESTVTHGERRHRRSLKRGHRGGRVQTYHCLVAWWWWGGETLVGLGLTFLSTSTPGGFGSVVCDGNAFNPLYFIFPDFSLLWLCGGRGGCSGCCG